MNGLHPDSPSAQQQNARSVLTSTHESAANRRNRIANFISRHEKILRLILICIIVFSIIAITILVIRLISNGQGNSVEAEYPNQDSVNLAQDVELYSMGYYSGDPQELYVQLEQIINSDSVNSTTKTTATAALADLYLADMDYQKAINLLESALELYPNPSNQVVLLSDLLGIYEELELVDQQINCLERIVAFSEDEVQLQEESWPVVRQGALDSLEYLNGTKSSSYSVLDSTNEELENNNEN